ncbi:MAG: hypoxanthine phosphoribosyltransferase [Bdellovibrionaceae bacterium]|nr:hypoxanthine phosphoribosyltransferase [Pseudobdellovibrionaceae bacterium]
MLKSELVPSISQDSIKDTVKKLAREIENDFEGEKLSIICPLKSHFMFCVDLMKEISLPQELDFVFLSSPPNESVKVIKDAFINIRNKNILIVTTVLDVGRSIYFLQNHLSLSYPKSIKLVTLFDKPTRRELAISSDYTGYTVDDRFIVGYGLDINEQGRNYKELYNFSQ